MKSPVITLIRIKIFAFLYINRDTYLKIEFLIKQDYTKKLINHFLYKNITKVAQTPITRYLSHFFLRFVCVISSF